MTDSPEKKAKDAATYIAVIVMAVMGIGILLFCALVLPDVVLIIFVLFGFAFTIYLQYIIWGRRLSQLYAKQEEESDSDN